MSARPSIRRCASKPDTELAEWGSRTAVAVDTPPRPAGRPRTGPARRGGRHLRDHPVNNRTEAHGTDFHAGSIAPDEVMQPTT
jgi:hypothetical protein